MAGEMVCGRCGTGNLSSKFRCANCRAFLGPVYPTVAGVGSLTAVYALWLLYVSAVLPPLAMALASHGARFSPFVRLAVSVGQYFTGWGSLAVLASLAFLLWLGLFWRPQRAWGSNVVITLALFKGVSALLVVLLSVLDVVRYL